jgi:predicted  nucleic acid-binding Zn-ribbon protein
MEQIRLKMATIKCQIRKVKLQLKQRKELGEALRAIDFEQLNIENQVCIRKIDEKNQHLLQMKKIAGTGINTLFYIHFCNTRIVEFNAGGYSMALTKHKKKVDGLTSTMNGVRDKIVSKKQEIVKLKSEQITAKNEIKKEEKQLKSIIELINNFEVIFFNIFVCSLIY